MDEVLVAEDVRKSYGDTDALDGVSLAVGEGEVFGLIGPNGAGKTTLVRALTGTTRVDGEVAVLGDEPPADPQRVGLLPQSFEPPGRLTARELIEYYAGLYDEARDTDAVLADVGLADAADTWYENLSGGQRRRTCVGAALVNDPDVLFLDEPTTAIDPAGRRALWGLLEELAAGGTTVFLTSHSMDEVERLSDRVGLLREGRLVAVGSPEELIDAHGGASRLDVGAADEAAAAAAATALRDAGYAVEPGTTAVTVVGVDPTEIGDAVRTLERAGAAYEELAWSEPTLEDVYLELTGEAFEEGAGARPLGGEGGGGSGSERKSGGGGPEGDRGGAPSTSGAAETGGAR